MPATWHRWQFTAYSYILRRNRIPNLCISDIGHCLISWWYKTMIYIQGVRAAICFFFRRRDIFLYSFVFLWLPFNTVVNKANSVLILFILLLITWSFTWSGNALLVVRYFVLFFSYIVLVFYSDKKAKRTWHRCAFRLRRCLKGRQHDR